MRATATESRWHFIWREIVTTIWCLLAATAGAAVITAAAIVFRISWLILPGLTFVALTFPEDTSGWVLISSQKVIALFVAAIVNVAVWTCVLFFSIPAVSQIVRRLRRAKPDCQNSLGTPD